MAYNTNDKFANAVNPFEKADKFANAVNPFEAPSPAAPSAPPMFDSPLLREQAPLPPAQPSLDQRAQAMVASDPMAPLPFPTKGEYRDPEQQKIHETFFPTDKPLPDYGPETPSTKDMSKRMVQDIGVGALKTSVNTADAFMGIVDAAVGIQQAPVRALKRKLGFDTPLPSQELKRFTGYDPSKAQDLFGTLYSEETQDAVKKVAVEQGVLKKIGAALQNPSAVGTTVMESLGPMLLGGAVAKGLRIAPAVGAGIGEGIVSGASQLEDVLKYQDRKPLTPKQVALVAATTAATALISIASGGLQKKLGLADIDTMIAGGGGAKANSKNPLVKMAAGALFESLGEELPQGTIEQINSNLSKDRPWNEGLDDAQAMGIISGAVMGSGANFIGSTDAPTTLDDRAKALLNEQGDTAEAPQIDGPVSDLTINGKPVPLVQQEADEVIPEQQESPEARREAQVSERRARLKGEAGKAKRAVDKSRTAQAEEDLTLDPEAARAEFDKGTTAREDLTNPNREESKQLLVDHVMETEGLSREDAEQKVAKQSKASKVKILEQIHGIAEEAAVEYDEVIPEQREEATQATQAEEFDEVIPEQREEVAPKPVEKVEKAPEVKVEKVAPKKEARILETKQEGAKDDKATDRRTVDEGGKKATAQRGVPAKKTEAKSAGFTEGQEVKAQGRPYTRSGSGWKTKSGKVVKTPHIVAELEGKEGWQETRKEAIAADKERSAKSKDADTAVRNHYAKDNVLSMVMQEGGIRMPKRKGFDKYSDEDASIPHEFRGKTSKKGKNKGLPLDEMADQLGMTDEALRAYLIKAADQTSKIRDNVLNGLPVETQEDIQMQDEVAQEMLEDIQAGNRPDQRIIDEFPDVYENVLNNSGVEESALAEEDATEDDSFDFGENVEEEAPSPVKAVNPRTGQTELIGQDEGGFALAGERQAAKETFEEKQAREQKEKDAIEATPDTLVDEKTAEPSKPIGLMKFSELRSAVEQLGIKTDTKGMTKEQLQDLILDKESGERNQVFVNKAGSVREGVLIKETDDAYFIRDENGKRSKVSKKAWEIQAPITEDVKAPSEEKGSLLDRIEADARAQIKELKSPGTMGMGKEAGIAANYAVIGAVKIARGTVKFSKWAAEMISEFGDSIKPHLKSIYAASRNIAANAPESQEAFVANAEREIARLEGRNLSLMSEDDNVRQMFVDVDRAREALGEPKPETFEQWDSKAQKIFDDSPEKAYLDVVSGDLDMSDPVNVRLAQKALSDAAGKDLTSGDVARVERAITAAYNVRKQGTELARALAARRDPSQTPAQRAQSILTQMITTPTAKESKAMETVSDKKRMAMIKKQARRSKQIIESLEREGINIGELSDLDALDKRKIAAAIRVIQAERGTVFDKEFEYWRNAILSAPTTQVANIVGNTAGATYEYAVLKPMEATLNALTGNSIKGGTTFKDLGRIYKGIFSGQSWLTGWQNAVDAFINEQPVVGGAKIEESGIAIGGKLGRGVRAPQRALLAADEFSKGMVMQIEVGAHAAQLGRKQGLKGETLDAFIAEEINDPGSASWARAYESSKDLTYQNEVGEIAKAVMKIRGAKGLVGFAARHVFPFVVTPTNIIKKGVRRTPLGSLVLPFALRDAAMGRMSSQKALGRVAEQVIAFGLTAVLGGLINDKDEEGMPKWITGSAPPSSDRGKKDFEWRNVNAQSIRVPGTDRWVSYSRIEPMATSLALIADLMRNDGQRMSEKTFTAITGLVRDKTFLRALSDVMELFEKRDLNAVDDYISNFAASYMPNIIKSTLRAGDDKIRQYMVEDPDDNWKDWPKRTGQRMLPHKSLMPPAKVDLFGREVKKGSTTGAPLTDFLYNAIVPIRTQAKPGLEPIDRFLINYNRDNEKQYWPKLPSASYTYKNERLRMTEQQYHDFLVERGEYISKRSSRINPDSTTQKEKDKLAKLFSEATVYAKRKVGAKTKALPPPSKARTARSRKKAPSRR